MNEIPDVLLAFTPAEDLEQLTTERDNVQKVIMSSGCNAPTAYGLTLDWLRSYSEKGTNPLLIFHYGGHASPIGLQYNKVVGGKKEPFTLPYEGLAAFMSSFRHLKLVFINGCNSETAFNFFYEKVDVLICTNQRVDDEEASEFAHIFYSNFLKTNDLRDSFELAQNFILMRQRGAIDFMRGVMETPDLAQKDSSAFQLKYPDNRNTEELDKSTFLKWRQSIQPSLFHPKETVITTKNMGLSANAYLRCNREDEVYFFEEGLGQKIDKQTSQPLFVFIHGLEEHCPFDLFDRFVIYTLAQEKWKLNTPPTEIDLPVNPRLNNLDLSKLTLLENYCHQGKFGQQNADRTWSLTQQMPDNEWIVIRHKLTYGEWKPNWGVFFDYYVNEFGQELAEKMSQKLIIVTTRATSSDDDDFAQYFKELAKDSTKQVVNLTGFKKITHDNIRAWRENVFTTEPKFMSSDIIPKNEEKFFFEIKELLKARLNS